LGGIEKDGIRESKKGKKGKDQEGQIKESRKSFVCGLSLVSAFSALLFIITFSIHISTKPLQVLNCFLRLHSLIQ
jgi:hypothetical protein